MVSSLPAITVELFASILLAVIVFANTTLPLFVTVSKATGMTDPSGVIFLTIFQGIEVSETVPVESIP